MNFFTLEESTVLPVPFDGRLLASDENIELIHILLKPGEKIAAHQNPLKVFFYILEGTATLEALGKVYLLEANSVVEIEPSIERTLKNKSHSNIRVLVIKIKN